ncbi:MAG: type II secretion system protein GspK [Planctomycetota bacterium]
MDESKQKPVRARPRNKGFALLIVMMLSIALAVIIWGFQREVLREISISRNITDDLQAEFLAEMGLVRGQVVLRLDEHTDYDSLNESWSEAMKWSGETFGAEDRYDDDERYSEPDAEGGDGEEGSGSGKVGDSPPSVLISDEDRKFNILTLIVGDDAQKRRAKEVFTRLVEICRRDDDRLELDGNSKSVRRAGDDSVSTNQLVDNLVKYLDERASEDGDDVEFSLAKVSKSDQRSMRKQTPYQMLTLGELLQVEGWTTELLYGPAKVAEGTEGDEDSRQTESYDNMSPEDKFEFKKKQMEGADENSRSPDPIGILRHLTLYSNGRININTASREVILALDKRLTWDVVDQIVTAREQDRRDVEEGEESGTIEEGEALETTEGAAEEEEDQASYRPQDIASFQAFVGRTSTEEPAEGEQSSIEGFTQEIYNGMRPWLTVRSTTYAVESSATVGKRTHTIRAIYRRTGTNQTPAAQPPAGGGEAAAPVEEEPTADEGLPAEPNIKLTLLFRDIVAE